MKERWTWFKAVDTTPQSYQDSFMAADNPEKIKN
jgi:hypothetical protein